MTSQGILWVSIGMAVFFILAFYFSRRSIVEPTKLSLRKNGAARPNQKDLQRARVDSATQAEMQTQTLGEKNLNVIFMYNGHSWDAFEILGLPAGAPFPMVEAAFQEMKRKSDPESYEFLEAAYFAIRQEYRSK